MNIVLYKDRSGVAGKWYKGEFSEWKFESRIKIDLSEENMEYYLKELKKIKKEQDDR